MNMLLHSIALRLWRRLRLQMAGLPKPAAENPPEWTAEHAGHLLHYLRSESGQTLLATLRHKEEQLKAIACTEEHPHPEHARGRAVGYRNTIATLIVLSAVPAEPEQNTADGADSGADRLRDQLSHS